MKEGRREGRKDGGRVVMKEVLSEKVRKQEGSKGERKKKE
jgi:hypothetical protein